MFGLVAGWQVGNDKQNQRKELRFEKSKHDASSFAIAALTQRSRACSRHNLLGGKLAAPPRVGCGPSPASSSVPTQWLKEPFVRVGNNRANQELKSHTRQRLHELAGTDGQLRGARREVGPIGLPTCKALKS
jgi:hypothetical protein